MRRSPLDARELNARLGPPWRVTVVERAGSTNADLLADADADADANADADADAAEFRVLVAEHQVSGRGRRDRVWTSPPRAGLTFSVLLRPRPPVQTWSWLPLLAGLAVRDAVREVAGVRAGVKWPNDVLDAGGGKLAGILVQATGSVAVIGIGLNVSTIRAELPVDTASSLLLAGAPDTLERAEVLVAILHCLREHATAWAGAGGDAARIAALYRQACVTLGREVQVDRADGSRARGHALDVDGGGRLVLEVDGSVEELSAGEVVHLRPA